MAVIGIYTNSYGNSIEFSRESGIQITSWGGLTSNSANIDETTAINQIGSNITGVGIQSKTHTIEGRYKYTKERRENLLSIVLPGDKGKLRYINTEADIDVYWDVAVRESPDISHGYYYQDFQFVVKAGFPYAKKTYKPSLEFSPLVSNFMFPRKYHEPFKISTKEFTPLRSIVNYGPVETGFVLTFTPNDNGVVGPYVINIDTQETISFPSIKIDIGEKVVVSTVANDRYCKFIDALGNETNIFKDSTFESVFFLMKPGVNNLRCGAVVKEANLDAYIEYDEVRAGI